MWSDQGPGMSRIRKVSGEGLRLARLLMVLSSLAPLFVLMAIRGNSLVPEMHFTGVCLSFATLPSLFLWWRVGSARRDDDVRALLTGRTEDHRSHVLVYLFATLLPFYREEIGSCRDLLAMCVALGFIVFLFWRLNLHYMNLFFAVAGYQVFTVSPPDDGNLHTGRESFVLITRRRQLREAERVKAYRLSNTVYLEKSL